MLALHISMADQQICTYIFIFSIFFWYVQLKRLGLINIFRCPVTMAMGSADIILNLIFQLPQCASPVSRIIESLLLLSPFLPPSLPSLPLFLPLVLLLHILSLPVAPSYDPKGINGGVLFFSFNVCSLKKKNQQKTKQIQSHPPQPARFPHHLLARPPSPLRSSSQSPPRDGDVGRLRALGVAARCSPATCAREDFPPAAKPRRLASGAGWPVLLSRWVK